MNVSAITGTTNPLAAYFPPSEGDPSTDDVTAIGAVEDVLDLTNERTGLFESLATLGGDEFDNFLELLATLLQAGVIGTEVLEVNGQRYENFAGNELADPNIARAPVYRFDERV